jgi:DNA-binding CsgD family transcriptional regulator
MKNDIKNHPVILNQNDIAELCKPLEKLNITYFGHGVINNNEFSALCNNADFLQHYLHNKYYNADIHMSNSDIVDNCIVWDSIEKRGKSHKLYQEGTEFGINHTFTIIEKNNQGENFYHFATSHSNESINQTYLANVDLLRLFIMKFNAIVKKNKHLSDAYKIKYKINQNNSGFIFDNVRTDRDAFIKELIYNNGIQMSNGKMLSTRQLQIFYWLHHGKTIRDISEILGIAEITINKQIADLKTKTNCYTQFQLGELFATLFNHSNDIIDSLIKTDIR